MSKRVDQTVARVKLSEEFKILLMDTEEEDDAVQDSNV